MTTQTDPLDLARRLLEAAGKAQTDLVQIKETVKAAKLLADRDLPPDSPVTDVSRHLTGVFCHTASITTLAEAAPAIAQYALYASAEIERLRGEIFALPKCPRCGSTDPAKHPAVQLGGEVQLCLSEWHHRTAIKEE